MVRPQVVAAALIVWACLITGLESRPGQSTSIETATIAGSIVDEGLTSIAAVAVTLTRTGDADDAVRTTKTDPNGLFRFDGVAAGNYQLAASMTSRESVRKSVAIRRVPASLRVGLVLPSVDAVLPLADRTARGPSSGAVQARSAVPWLPSEAGRGTIHGRIADAFGGVIPGATITLSRRNPTTSATAISNGNGDYRFEGVPDGAYVLRFLMPGFIQASKDVALRDGESRRLDQILKVGAASETVMVSAEAPRISASSAEPAGQTPPAARSRRFATDTRRALDTARYATVRPNPWVRTSDDPRSTFAADIDTGSYTNVRRFINVGALPPTDAVRVEEFVNYFSFDYRGGCRVRSAAANGCARAGTMDTAPDAGPGICRGQRWSGR